jgi:DnaJ-class molecular chaperone
MTDGVKAFIALAIVFALWGLTIYFFGPCSRCRGSGLISRLNRSCPRCRGTGRKRPGR